jgi:tetratricopeptide (TPR) repeat protein
MANSVSKLTDWVQLWLQGKIDEHHLLKQMPPAVAKTEELLGGSPPSAGYQDAFLAAARHAREIRSRLEVSDEAAAQAAEELVTTPPEKVAEGLLNEPGRWRPAVIQALVKRSREVVTRDTGEAFRRADLALRAAWVFFSSCHREVGGNSMLHDQRARCFAHQGNALRLRSDYLRAEERFRLALEALELGSGDPLVEAEVHHLLGSLMRDRRHFQEAREALRRAGWLYRSVGESQEAAKVLMNRAQTEREAADPHAAVGIQRRAIALLDFDKEPWWEAAAYINLALYLAEAGYGSAARRALDEHPLAPDADLRHHMFRDWIEGVVECSLGHYERASEKLEEARQGFASVEDGHRFAMATLDLALAQGSSGRWSEIHQLAAESLSILHSLDVPGDAVAAFMVFQQATAAEALTVATLRQMRRGLEEPRLWRRHEEPS